jgi:CO/xanthine dehydrogenase FAD-binding subunit
VPYGEFHLGYRQTLLAPDELIKAVHLPRLAGRRHFFRKVGPRRAQAISKVCFAAMATMSADRLVTVAIALGSVAPTPLLCRETARVLTGERLDSALIAAGQAALAKEISPIDDIRSTRDYRSRVAQNLLRDFLLDLSHAAAD